MLKFESVDVFYGPAQALFDVSFHVEREEIVALIGANGAGKSTVLKTVSGLLQPRRGRIRFEGQALAGLPVESIVARGISQVPEGRRVFPGLTVEGNLEVATSPWRRRGEDVRPALEDVYQLFPKLRERRAQLAWSLSGGEQQMLSIGRALAARPKLMLLDEPSLGLAPMLVSDMFRTIREINRRGTTILLVEQNASAALRIAHRGYVLENGRMVLSAGARDLLRNPHVKEAYLGGGSAPRPGERK